MLCYIKDKFSASSNRQVKGYWFPHPLSLSTLFILSWISCWFSFYLFNLYWKERVQEKKNDVPKSLPKNVSHMANNIRNMGEARKERMESIFPTCLLDTRFVSHLSPFLSTLFCYLPLWTYYNNLILNSLFIKNIN